MTNKNILHLPIDDVKEHPENARVGDVSAIARSLEAYGQVSPIIVQESTMFIVKGNHTHKAAKQLGWQGIDALVEPMDDKTAKAFLVADNLTSDKARYDDAAKARLYGGLLGDEVLEGMGIRDEYESLMEDTSGAKETKRTGQEPAPRIELGGDGGPDGLEEPAPTRDITLTLPTSQLGDFTKRVQDLQSVWNARTLAEIVTRAVAEAHGRWQADAARTKQADAVPLVEANF